MGRGDPPHRRARGATPTRGTDRAWGALAALSLGRPLATSVTVHSTTVPAGGVLTFTADGFAPSADLRVYLDNHRQPCAEHRLDGGGRTPENQRVPVPANARPGAHLLTFDDGTSDFDLLVHVTAPTAHVTAEPAVVAPGGRIRFAGRGFPPGRVVSLKLGTDPDPAATFPIGPDGAITGAFTLPTDTPLGPCDLRFLAAAPATSAAATITVTDPA